MNQNITRSQVMDRAGNRIEPSPMATYCEPSQRAIIRARSAQDGQRIERTRNEALALLRRIDPEEWLPQRDKAPELPELPEIPALDPVLNAEFIAGLITGLALAAVVAGALLLGDRL